MAKKILFVDDDMFFVESYKERLIISGYEVIHQLQSDKAPETAVEIKPDLIILDLMMPVMSGEEVFRKLKENPVTKDIPIFIMTALSGNSKLRESLTKEADEYIVKSETTPKDFVKIVDHKLK